jgi:hypothetical protein
MGIGGLGFWVGLGGLTCEFWAVFAKNKRAAAMWLIPGALRRGSQLLGGRDYGAGSVQGSIQGRRADWSQGKSGFVRTINWLMVRFSLTFIPRTLGT